jgi:hypothetical protein
VDPLDQLARRGAVAVDDPNDQTGTLAELRGEVRVAAVRRSCRDAETIEDEVLQRCVAPDLVVGRRQSGRFEGRPRELTLGRVGPFENEGGG